MKLLQILKTIYHQTKLQFNLIRFNTVFVLHQKATKYKAYKWWSERRYSTIANICILIAFLVGMGVGFWVGLPKQSKAEPSQTGAIVWEKREVPGSISAGWTAIVSSADGTKLAAATMLGYIYTSVDSGNTWVKRTGPGRAHWRGINISADGKVIVAIPQYYGTALISTDGGETWVERHTGNGASYGPFSVALSTDGSKIVVSGQAAGSAPGYIYTSIDYGQTWTARTGAGNRKWSGLASSSNGDKLAASVNGGYIYTSTDSGATWSERTTAGSRSWTSITASGDGSVLVGTVRTGYIYTSTDSGATWSERTSAGSRAWKSAVISSDGTKILAAVSNGYIYYSSDTGATWTERTESGSRNWVQIAASSDNAKVAGAVSYGYIYTSTNSGTNWVEHTDVGARAWTATSSSADGSKLAAVANTNYIYTSNDGGITWIEQTGSGQRYWIDIASSSDGIKLVAVVNGGYIYTSNDSGNTWTERTNSGLRSWTAVASSSDGTKLIASVSNGFIYTSTDSGNTWTERTNLGAKYWYSVTSSADGNKLAVANVVTDYPNIYIYTSVDGGATWTERTSIGTGHTWLRILSSADGNKLVAYDSGSVYFSNDSGATWTQSFSKNTGGFQFKSSAMSADGSRIIVSGGGVNNLGEVVFMSADGGATWTTNNSVMDAWQAFAMSADGNKIIGASLNNLYIGRYDSTAPTATVASITNNSTNNTLPNLSGNITDDISGASSLEFQVDSNSGNWLPCTVDNDTFNCACSDWNNCSTSQVYSESFEGVFPPDGYTTGGNANWLQSSTVYQDGVKSAGSGDVSHAQSTYMAKTVTVAKESTLSFYWKVSSEPGFDYLAFCLDNAQCGVSWGYTDRIAGEIDWTEKSVTLTPGTHALKWVYGKDNSSDIGSDMGWVDNITITETNCTPDTLLPLSDGPHTMYLRATDSVGNVSESSYSFTVDTIPPTGNSISVNSASKTTKSNSIALTLASTGASNMMLSTDPNFIGASWQTYATTADFTLPSSIMSSNGNKTIYAKFKDLAGNISDSVSSTFIVDTTPPKISLTPLDSNETYSTQPAFIGNLTDTYSNISNLSYWMDNTTNRWNNCTATDGSFNSKEEAFTCAITTNLPLGTHKLVLRAYDSTGNLTPSTSYTVYNFNVIEPPVTVSTTTTSTNNLNQKTVNLFRITITDASGNPIVGAVVTIESLNQTVITDANGIATFTNIEKGQHQLIINYNGKTEVRGVYVTGLQNNLEVKTQQLKPIEEANNTTNKQPYILLAVIAGGLTIAIAIRKFQKKRAIR